MIRQPGALIFVFMFLWLPCLAQAAETTHPLPTWQPLGRGLSDTRFAALAVDPRNARLLYAASIRAVYESRDGGMKWRSCWRAAGSAAITALAVDPFDSRHIVVATTEGVYISSDGARRWTRAFRAGGDASRCRAILFHPARKGEVFLGTDGGPFTSWDGGLTWQPMGLELGHPAVWSLAMDARDPARLYMVSDEGAFVFESAHQAWRKIFDADSAGEETPEEPSESTDESAEATSSPRQLTTIAIDPTDPQRLYLATTQGVLTSADRGMTWQRVTRVGLGTPQVRHLIVQANSPVVAYVATSQGVARYHVAQQRWDILYAGLPARSIRFLAAAGTKVYAATDDGLYLLDLTDEQLAQGNWPPAREILSNFVREPTIERVQKTAIAYAEVQPEKISQWRQQATMQAFLPTLSFDYDQNRDTYIASSVTSTSAPKAITLTDPSHSFGVSIDWDLGELIWNDDQTSIDSRSKLMVELRDEILDEVTRTYFERRRLQVELLTNPPADPKEQLDTELRIQELTALLDGLTGGWFSQEVAAMLYTP